MKDKFENLAPGLTAPATSGGMITPDDNQPLPQLPRALYVGGTGDVVVEMLDGQALTLANMQGGLAYPIRVRKVLASGTTATGLVALW